MTNRENLKSTNKKLADIAGVKPTTYKMGAKVFNSDNEELKELLDTGVVMKRRVLPFTYTIIRRNTSRS